MKKKSPQSNITFPLYSTKWLGPVPTRRFDGGVGVGVGGCGCCCGMGSCDSCGFGGGNDGGGKVVVVA